MQSGAVGACVSTLAEHPTLAERRFLLDPHLAKATGRWCLYTHGNERHNSASRPVILTPEVTKSNLPAFIFPIYFVSHSPKVHYPVPVKLESGLCHCVSPREPSGRPITGLESAHNCALMCREAAGHIHNH